MKPSLQVHLTTASALDRPSAGIKNLVWLSFVQKVQLYAFVLVCFYCAIILSYCSPFCVFMCCVLCVIINIAPLSVLSQLWTFFLNKITQKFDGENRTLVYE